MDDAAIKTAEVEVLTAEVHVLMVGSRQITLSVARQLDVVPLAGLIPFGRVRTRDYAHAVIGKDRDTGTLVLATYRSEPPAVFLPPECLPEKLLVCAKWIRDARTYGRHIRLRYNEWPIEVPSLATTACDHSEYGNEECETWQSRGSAAVIATRVRQARLAFAPDAAAAALPLIVLAGLR